MIPTGYSVVVCLMPSYYTPRRMDRLSEVLDERNPRVAVLWHHPADPKRLSTGEAFDTPGLPMLILQDRAQLEHARNQLEKTLYYKYY